MKKVIRGSGGGGKEGGGGGNVPTEDPDSLQSKAFAQVLDLVSEGEIEGLVDGLKSIYLDGTAIQNADGSYNFTGIEFDFRTGSQAQSYIPKFADTENEIAVGVEVLEATPLVRSVTNENVDALRIKVSIPQLTTQNTSTGDLKGGRVSIAIDLQSDGGGYVEKIADTIIGKSTSKYERQYRIELEGNPPWDFRVRRITEDSDSVAVQNRTYVESYTQIIDTKFRYPNSALVGVRIDSSQFNSVPTRAFDIKGIQIQVPTNYDPDTREYDGVWDGTFKVAWSNNPAWVFYDLVTNERYGLGSFIPADQVDKWTLYTIAQYCDELVPDGLNGFEPRYTCNVYIQTRQEAFNLLQNFASNFNSMIYWAGGTLTLSQDAPADAAYLFTPANVVDGVFNYSGASAKSRHSVALVTWNDPDDFYRQKIEYVEDTEAIARFGIVEAQVTAFGCTSRGQANRFGRWLLFTERMQSETVSFKTGLTASLCRPGQIIKVADPTRAGTRLGGRVQASSTTSITIDADVVFDPSGSVVSVMMADGTVEDRNVQSFGSRVIVPTVAFSAAPPLNTIWLVSSLEVEPQQFRIITVTEEEGGVHSISALAHEPAKFDAIEEGLILPTRSISTLDVVPDAPLGLQITETLYEVNADVRVKVTISWNAVPFATTYQVSYKRDDQNIIVLPQTSSNDIEILNAEPGLYEVTVVALNSLGTRSLPSTASKQIIGKTLPPSDIIGFSLIPSAGMAYLSWNKSTDLDVLIGGSVRIRHSPLTTGVEWKDSIDVSPALSGSSSRAQVPLMVGTYLAKFVDSSGIASDNAVSIVTTVPEALALNVVETITESPGYAGTKTNMEYSADYLGLVISAGTLIDDVGDIDAILAWDFAGGVNPTGTYEFENYVDLTEVYTSKITAAIQVSAVDVADAIDFREELIDTWVDLDGVFIDDVNAELFVSTTLDDPNGLTPDWSEWKRVFVGEYSARGLKFKLEAVSNSGYHNIIVKALSVTIDMPDRVVNMAGIVSGTSVYTVTYAEAFKETPAIGITGFNMNSGDYHTITNNTEAGFDIVFKNASAVNVSRNFDVVAKGYGRKLN